MSLPPWSVYPLLLCFLFSWMTLAQPSTTAQCDKSFNWMDNSDGQSPCLVAAYAFSACSSADINIPSVTNTSYNPPAGDNVTPCACSSVTYALLNACLVCQNAQTLSWATWSQNCPSDDISNGSFPEGVDMEAVIPSWAFQLVQPSSSIIIRPSAGGGGVVSGTIPSFTSTPRPPSSIISSTGTSTTQTSSSSRVFSSSTPTASTSSTTSSRLSSTSTTTSSSSRISSVSGIAPTGAITVTALSSSTTSSTAVTPSSSGAVLPSSSSGAVLPSSSSSPVGDVTIDLTSRKRNLDIIIGGSVGVGLLLILGLVAFSLHVRRKQKEEDRRMAPYRVDGLRLYDPEDETTYPKAEWPTVSTYSDRRSIIQLHDPGHRLVPNRSPAMLFIPEV